MQEHPLPMQGLWILSRHPSRRGMWRRSGRGCSRKKSGNAGPVIVYTWNGYNGQPCPIFRVARDSHTLILGKEVDRVTPNSLMGTRQWHMRSQMLDPVTPQQAMPTSRNLRRRLPTMMAWWTPGFRCFLRPWKPSGCG
jgi:hypothetical protein